MLLRIYQSLWLVYWLAALVLFVTGAMTSVAVVAFGFVAFGLVFMGMMCVLPFTVSHPPDRTAPEPGQAQAQDAKHRIGWFTKGNAILHGAKAQRPHFH